jgi:hypothetical protein
MPGGRPKTEEVEKSPKIWSANAPLLPASIHDAAGYMPVGKAAPGTFGRRGSLVL